MLTSSKCCFLEWDTNFFGVRIGRIESNDLDADEMQLVMEWAAEHQIDCLYYCCTIDSDRARKVAEAFKFNLVDVKIEMSKLFSRSHHLFQNTSRDNLLIRPYADSDLIHLEELDDDLFKNARFYHDPHFTHNQASLLYQEWIRTSCQADGESVLVAEYNNQIAGYITYGKEGLNSLRIGILGVSQTARRLGIGGSLLNDLCNQSKDSEINEIKVVTQGRNIAAQNLYQKHGFYTDSMALWYHKWFNSKS